MTKRDIAIGLFHAMRTGEWGLYPPLRSSVRETTIDNDIMLAQRRERWIGSMIKSDGNGQPIRNSISKSMKAAREQAVCGLRKTERGRARKSRPLQDAAILTQEVLSGN